MDASAKGELYEYSFMAEHVKVIHHPFEIPSPWARGQVETIMVSILVEENLKGEIFKEPLLAFAKNLLANKRLNGFYDEETQTFMDSTSMAAMSLNLKRNQVVEYIEGVKRQTFKALDEVKAFINGENLGPSQIEAVENILKVMGEKYRAWNTERDRLEHPFEVAMREHKANLKNIPDETERKTEETRLATLEGEVSTASAEFKTMRGVIDDLLKDSGKIFHLVKTIRRKPENVEAMQARLDEMLARYYLKDSPDAK